MLTRQESLLDFMGTPDARLVIPVYQRVYSWDERQCDELWADILHAGRAGSTHFVGTLLYAPEAGDDAGAGTQEGESSPGYGSADRGAEADCPDGRRLAEQEPGKRCVAGAPQRQFDIVDGQQRLATVTILLTALRDHLRETSRDIDGMDARDIDRRFLLADAADCKLLLSRADRASMAFVVQGAVEPEEDGRSANVERAYGRFLSKMESFDAEDDKALWRGLGLLLAITAELEEGDRPQLVFESLNSKGMPLDTVDLVRNLLLANIGLDEQSRLYEQYWAPLEQLFGGQMGSQQANAALRGWLAVTAPQLSVGKGEVYPAFKTYVESMHKGTVEELLMGLLGFCKTFAARASVSGSSEAQSHANWANGKVEGIISKKKLFGD